MEARRSGPVHELPAAAWVPRTKVVRPVPPADAVLDEHLLDRLQRAVAEVPVTLICAQAGAGKTTLAAALADRVDMPVAWVSLDERDRGPMLLELLALALDPILANGCPGLSEVLATPAGAHDAARAVGVLINDVLDAGPDPFLLVLDDVQALDDPALEILDALVAHPPPSLRVVLASRTEPRLSLARLRARGLVADVGSVDLRFTAKQADVLLNRHLALGLDRSAIEQMVDTAGGWVTGLRLLARAGVPAPDAALYDYLAAEILDAEAEETRRFLLDTSVLDELTPERCAAVSGRAEALALLEDIHRRNPFLVIAIEPARGLYRYHDLFAAFLRSRLAREAPERAVEMHRRAADASGTETERIEHLLAAGAHHEAAKVIEEIVAAGFPRPIDLRRLAGWIDRLDERVAAERPWLHLATGMAAVQRGAMSEAIGPLEHALDALDDRTEFAGHWMAVRGLHVATVDHRRFVPMLMRLEAAPQFGTLPAPARVDHYISSAYGALFANQWDDVARRVAGAIELTTATGDVGAVEVLAQHLSPLVAAADGVLDRIEGYAEWTALRFGDGLPMIRAGRLHQQALVAFLRGRYDDALTFVADAADLPERLGGLPYLRATLDWVETAVWFARGDLAAVERRLTERKDTAPTDLDRDMVLLSLALLARVLRLQRRPDDLATLVRTTSVAPASRFGDHLTVVAAVVRAHALAAGGAAADGVDALRAVSEVIDRLRLVPFVGSARLDLAVLLAAAGERDAAVHELIGVLRDADARGMPGLVAAAGAEVVPLLEEARASGMYRGVADAALAVLGQTQATRPVAVPGSDDVLSAREVEVLRLLAAGSSNQDIADTLVVSMNTVKTHVQRVLAKLDARSRTEAVARARRLHLL